MEPPSSRIREQFSCRTKLQKTELRPQSQPSGIETHCPFADTLLRLLRRRLPGFRASSVPALTLCRRRSNRPRPPGRDLQKHLCCPCQRLVLAVDQRQVTVQPHALNLHNLQRTVLRVSLHIAARQEPNPQPRHNEPLQQLA